MKTKLLLLTILGSGALTLGVSYAGESPRLPAKPDSHANHAAALRPAGPVRGDGSPMEPNHSQLNNTGHTSERSNPAGSLHTETKRPSLNGPHQLAVKKAAIAAKDGSTMHQTRNPHEQPARLPAGYQAVALRPGIASGRSATAAMVGRVLITSNTKYSAGPLDGVAIKRKP
jgi:hypothetical protein